MTPLTKQLYDTYTKLKTPYLSELSLDKQIEFAAFANDVDLLKKIKEDNGGVNLHEASKYAYIYAMRGEAKEALAFILDDSDVRPTVDRSNFIYMFTDMQDGFDLAMVFYDRDLLNPMQKQYMYLKALIRGRDDIAEQLESEGINFQADKGTYYMLLKQVTDHEDIESVTYLFAEGYDIVGPDFVSVREALKHDYYNLLSFYLDNVNLPDDLTGAIKRRYANSQENIDSWMMRKGVLPWGMRDDVPHYYKQELHDAIIFVMHGAENHAGVPGNKYALNTTGLFGNMPRIISYFQKWANPASVQPLHDLLMDIKLPKTGRFNRAVWGDAVLKHGPKMARLVKFANKVPEPEKDAAGKGWSYIATRDKVAEFAYERAKKYPDIAKLAMTFGWDDEEFEDAIKVVEKYKKKYAANDNKKTLERIPDITINGEAFDKPGYTFSKLPDGDVRGLFLGEFTDCCQHLANQGASCAKHGYLSEEGGFYVVEKDGEDDVVAQAWAWRGEKGELVFDSLESLKGHFNAQNWTKLCSAFSEKLKAHEGISSLMIGRGGATPGLSFEGARDPAKPIDYKGYRDSKRQYQIKIS